MQDISELQKSYFHALCELDEKKTSSLIEGALAGGVKPDELLIKVVIPSIDQMNEELIMGQEINLAQHYLSAKISESIAMKLLDQVQTAGECPGCVVIGTAVGDFHGLGKKIVIACLRAHMFKVIDAGTHVSPEAFVDLAIENNAQVIGISSMMAHTATGPNGALGVRKILRERELEGKIKIMVGGAPFRFDHGLYEHVNADGWGENGLEAVATAKRLIKEVEG
ncbi:MAG: cobalamin-dependent protein [Planctomycetes bacterium]|nr:cobalamin-dependent protein [Planctomycetota bacterium]